MSEKEKILFINPREEVLIEDFNFLFSTLEDIMSLSAIAKKRDYETEFINYNLNNQPGLLTKLIEIQPAFLVIKTSAFNYEKELSLLNVLDGYLDETIVIAYGPNFSYNSYSAIQKHPLIDIVLRYEIEKSFDEIIQYNDLRKIKGITYQVENKITQTPDRQIEENLDYLLNLDRDIINLNFYTRFDTKKTYTPIRISKGCPNDSFFSISSFLTGTLVRYRNPQNIIEEIKECIEKYKIYDFYFMADAFNFDNEEVKKLCRLIIESNLKINYMVSLRVDLIDYETLQLMKLSGCNLVIVDMGCADNSILEKIGKNITKEEIENKIKLINKIRIPILATYVLGSPWETKETIEKTYEFAKKLNTDYAYFYSATALVGSKYYDYIIKNRLGEISLEKPFVFPSIRSYGLSSYEVFEYNKKYNKEYPLRTKYIIKKAINSLLK